MHPFSWLAALGLILAGCGAPPSSQLRMDDTSRAPAAAAEAVGSAGAADPVPGKAAAGRTVAQRKIIYVANISLVVDDFARVEQEIPRLVQQFDGYLADVAVNRTQGTYRTGRWIARIPVDHYDAFLEALPTLGIAESRQQTAQDVTEEYVDLQARIANKQRLEERIVKLLEDRSGEIAEVIEVERELGRVREEIERMQGRLQFLVNRTSLTTVEIQAREQRGYVPPEAPGFGGRVAAVWHSSLRSLGQLGQFAALAVVGSVPWLAVCLVLLTPPMWYLRRRKWRS